MKVKNIVFSGFAAAILMGTAGANAATPFRIASQAYVDSKVSTGLVDESTGNPISVADALETKANASAVDTLDEQINGNGTTTSGLVGAVNTLTGDANTPGSVAEAKAAADDAQADVDALGEAIGDGFSEQNTVADAIDSKADAAALGAGIGTGAGEKTVAAALAEKANATDLTALTTRVATAEGEIDGLQAQVGNTAMGTNAETVTGAIKELGESISSLTGGAGSVANQINDKLGSDFGGENGYATVTAALADKADASTVATDAEVAELLGSGITASSTVTDQLATKAAASDVTALQNLTAILSGYTSCVNDANNESEHCVLSVAKGGTPTWVPVTDPWQVEP